MTAKCSGCGRFSNPTDGVRCTKCLSYNHRVCIGLPKDAKVAPGWLCPKCKAHTPKKDNTDIPVGGVDAPYEVSVEESKESSSIDLLVREMRMLRQDMQSFRSDIATLQATIGDLQGVVGSFEGRLSGVENRLSLLEQRSGEDRDGSRVDKLLSTISDLKLELNERDQEAFSNDLELSGIPEEPNESAVHLVITIAEKLGVKCDERDLVFAERVGVRRAPSGGGESSSVPRPRVLVVRLARRLQRDALVQAARVRRGLTTESMGLLSSPMRVYVNERLTRHNKVLFRKTREEARTHAWKFVWTRAGRVFVRQEAGKPAMRVRIERDLEKVFGAGPQSIVDSDTH